MNTVISVKVNKETKEAAQEVAKSMGLNLSSLINSYLIQVVATRRVELFAPEKMTPKLEKMIGKIEKDIQAGVGLSPAFSNAEDFLKDLKKSSMQIVRTHKFKKQYQKLPKKMQARFDERLVL